VATIEQESRGSGGVRGVSLAVWTGRLLRLKRRSRRTLLEAESERGQAMVEFVIILPLFLALIFIVIGYAVALGNYDRATDVARVGARAASISRFAYAQLPCNGNQLGGQAKTRTVNAASGLTLMNGTPTCSCQNANCDPGTNVSVTVTVQAQNVLGKIPFLSAALPGGSCQCWTSTATAVLQ